MKIIRQGFFREMPHGDKYDPSIFLYIREKGDENESRIIEYLESGIVLIACGGVVNDVINPDNGNAGCPNMLTDGQWMWPGDLSYYVKKYHLMLDEQFIKTMVDNEWSIDNAIKIDYSVIYII